MNVAQTKGSTGFAGTSRAKPSPLPLYEESGPPAAGNPVASLKVAPATAGVTGGVPAGGLGGGAAPGRGGAGRGGGGGGAARPPPPPPAPAPADEARVVDPRAARVDLDHEGVGDAAEAAVEGRAA